VAPGAKISVLEGDLKAAEPFTFRLKLPPNSKLGVHTHPTFERVTMLSGVLYFATGDKFDSAKAKAYKPGDAFMIPPGCRCTPTPRRKKRFFNSTGRVRGDQLP